MIRDPPLLQILYDLHPMDLINLGLVCKKFHEMLYRPSSADIWRTVRDRNEIPDFPSKLRVSEQRFAELVFCETCHLCKESAKSGTTMKRRIIWGMGIAVCEICHWSRLVAMSDLAMPKLTFLLKIMPTTDTPSRSGCEFHQLH
ncbi:hypothetical protein M413DRAFT_274616 [Hebeloma cylindrosporum]|uniref:F-box domain-containing protein n=1 Tax=Hebeloma cylindrosporum TaxID=76867 RepID=A0A0C2XHV1_HEBCY|nr:hypothetical protein M413DRAFT_274616 [Hebeloma cylindrosporum h7]